MTTKQDTLVSGTNIKTINNQSILGSGNIDIEGVSDYTELTNKPSINGTTLEGNVNLATPEQLNAKQDTLVSGSNIKTINNQSLLGSGDIKVNRTRIYANDIKDVENGVYVSVSTNTLATDAASKTLFLRLKKDDIIRYHARSGSSVLTISKVENEQRTQFSSLNIIGVSGSFYNYFYRVENDGEYAFHYNTTYQLQDYYIDVYKNKVELSNTTIDTISGDLSTLSTGSGIPSGATTTFLGFYTKFIKLNEGDFINQISNLNELSGNYYIFYYSTNESETRGNNGYLGNVMNNYYYQPEGAKYCRVYFKPTTFNINNTLSLKITMQYHNSKLEYCYDGMKENVVNSETRFISFRVGLPTPESVFSSGTIDYLSNNTITYDNGYILLPPNYTTDGEPVPLAIFFHGTDGYSFTETNIGRYERFLKFVRDNGYAVCDCSGRTYLYKNSGNSKATNVAWTCYVNMYEFIINQFNVRKDGVYVFGKSAGGMFSALSAYQSQIPIKCIGGLAPSLSYLGTDMRYTSATDLNYALSIHGCPSPSVSNSLSGTNDKTYVLDNISRFYGYDPFTLGTILNPSDVLTAMYTTTFTNYDNNTALHNLVDTAAKYMKVPMKIWHAVDDDAVPIQTSRMYAGMVKNGGGICYVREFPANTGRHHAVDDDTNAPTCDYTTKYNGTTNIPVAYAELVDWFNSWGGFNGI